MNTVSWILVGVLAVAVGYAIVSLVKRKGKCAGCDGNCACCTQEKKKK